MNHGFTVIEVPDGWQNEYCRPHDWREHFIYKALKQAADLPQPDTERVQTSGYDVELADFVLKALNKAYPQSLHLLQIKYDLAIEPSDSALLNSLDALVGDNCIEGSYLRASVKLRPMANIKITGDGRKYLQDEMKRKSAQSRQTFHINDASAFILKQLLAEFRDQNLTHDDLRSQYQGLPPAELKLASVAEGISEVDFDLSMSDMQSCDLVKTGPMELVDSPPGMVVIGFRSKNEYSYLTVDGYREAVKLASMPTATVKSSPEPSRAVIHGDQIINYGYAAAIGRQSHGQINYQGGWSDQ